MKYTSQNCFTLKCFGNNTSLSDFTQSTLAKKIKLSDDQVVPSDIEDGILNDSDITFNRNNNLPENTIDVASKHKDVETSDSRDNEEMICIRCDDKCSCQNDDPLHIDAVEMEVKPDNDIREEMDSAVDLTEIIEFKDEIIDDIVYEDEKNPDISLLKKVIKVYNGHIS